ncbi:MAG: CehA/McbA family metallohydrolase [Candidatus Bathyarchaeia archaeon]|nr:CehA/McbA family metallohydrolase [Candidatus Bathyarchaeota archaeon]
MLLKIDLHVHTCYSYDSNISLKSLLMEARRKGLDGVAVTDHDTVDGALKACKIASEMGMKHQLIVIPGIEVSTKRGHILGLNVTEPIPMGLGVEETINRIHEAGGIAIAAHPQSYFFKDGIGLSPKILSFGLDGVEVMNSALFPFKPLVQACKNFAEKHNLPQTAGSDSHVVEAIGLAYTLIDAEEKSVDSIIRSIKKGLTTPLGTGMPLTLRIKKLFRSRNTV